MKETMANYNVRRVELEWTRWIKNTMLMSKIGLQMISLNLKRKR